MTIGLLKEPHPETRVSLLAEAVATLTKKGITVLVEKDAGEKAFCSNADYEKAGAKITDATEIVSSADILLAIHQPDFKLQISKAKILIGVYQPSIQRGYDERMGFQWNHYFFVGYAAPYYPCAVDGCIEFAGKYCGL